MCSAPPYYNTKVFSHLPLLDYYSRTERFKSLFRQLAPLVRSPRAVERKAPTLDVQDDNSRATTFGISQTSPIYQDSPINTDEKPTLPVPAPREVTCDHVDAILPEGLPVSISSADQAHSNFAPTVFSPGFSKPLASNALNGRKRKYSLRSRVNIG